MQSLTSSNNSLPPSIWHNNKVVIIGEIILLHFIFFKFHQQAQENLIVFLSFSLKALKEVRED